ncbi:PsbP domain-containing protein 5, chloroplastic [Zea mays]|uniref:PsbP domain-containing protein 5, chloroplastic n=2 Tax=Zea mays TaxID=4577 RepID=A0A8J8Y6J7_MAIZE|nr:PsbP domain-containing protein 5 chloroplastic [Zea mays]PWZ09119.1 PsbP domain-containing protein 5, chloroplastic [Zea mays]
MAGALLSSPHTLPSPTSQSPFRPRHALPLPLTRFPARRLFVLLCTEHPPSLTALLILVPGDCAGAGDHSTLGQRVFCHRGGGPLCSLRALASLPLGTAGWRWRGGAFSCPGSCLLSQSCSPFQSKSMTCTVFMIVHNVLHIYLLDLLFSIYNSLILPRGHSLTVLFLKDQFLNDHKCFARNDSVEAYAVMETDEDVKMNTQIDEINAYSFLYPVELPGKKFTFKWIKLFAYKLLSYYSVPRVESRKPERYSSAAPLSPDARQRIVSERVDMIHNVVISVSIGPPNSRFLPSKDKSSWDPKDVADCILSDRSTMKVTTGQRMTESSVLDAHVAEVDGEPYWYYEYLVRKSPTKSAPEPNLFRHNVACTAERDGYLYSLNASTLSKQWESMGPFLQKTVASFRLLPGTENYVPPYKDPWRFW